MKRKRCPRIPVLGIKGGRSSAPSRPPIGGASVGSNVRIPDGRREIGFDSGTYRRGGGMRGAE